MCLLDRKTDNLGRPPAFFLICVRTRILRRAFSSLTFSSAVPLLLLAFLAQQSLRRVLDALALIGLRLTELADFCGDLADLLTVGPGNGDRGRTLGLDRDPGGDRIGHVVESSRAGEPDRCPARPRGNRRR